MTPPRPGVLFVDDVPQVLHALRTRLFRKRREWEMHFVGSGPDALECMEQHHIDIVISDMRMPGMDGLELMSRVRERHPRTLRFILSGAAEAQRALAATPLVHQYFTKPIDALRLVECIELALQVHRASGAEQSIGEVLSRVELNPLPQVVQTLLDRLNEEDPDLAEVAMLAGSDPVLSARLLALTNSALFRRGQAVTDVRRAVARLGLHTLRMFLLGPALLDQVAPRDPELEQAFRRSAQRTAERAAAGAPPSLRPQVYTAALLQDIGTLVFRAIDPCFQPSVVPDDPDQQLRTERAVFGFTHCEAGAWLLQAYGLPSDIVDSVARHHEPAHPDDPELLRLVKRSPTEDEEAA